MEKAFFKNPLCKYVSFDKISNFNFIAIDEGEIDPDGNITYSTSMDYPVASGLSFKNMSIGITINKDYYLSNKDEVKKQIIELIKNYHNLSIELSGSILINKDYIDAICSNETIKKVRLVGDRDNIYKLSLDMYKTLKSCGHIEKIDTIDLEDELQDCDDSIIGLNFRKVIDSNTLKDLKTKDSFCFINISLNDENKYYLKYLNPAATINVLFDSEKSFDKTYNNLKEAGIKNKIIIGCINRKEFEEYARRNKYLEFEDNLYFIVEFNTYPIKKFYEVERLLYTMIEPALSLSPLEKYLYAYKIVKQFKIYKEDEDDRSRARSIYEILDNDYMVCVGFQTLLLKLLEKLGITAFAISADVVIGMDENTNDDIVAIDNSSNAEGHARVQVKIDDDKYNVHGIYMADPTWDNSLKYDFYNYALMTQEEYSSTRRMNKVDFTGLYTTDFYDEMLNCSSIEEFYHKVNFAIDRRIGQIRDKEITREIEKINSGYDRIVSVNKFNIEMMKNLINECLDELNIKVFNINGYDKDLFIKKLICQISYDGKYSKLNGEKLKQYITEIIKNNYKLINIDVFSKKALIDVVNYLLNFIKKYDISLYNKILEQYNDLKNLEEDKLYEIIEICGNYIVSMVNNQVDSTTLFQAIKEVYKAFGMKNEDVNDEIEHVIDCNIKRQSRAFPKIIKINQDGTEEVYLNGDNKFESAGKLK